MELSRMLPLTGLPARRDVAFQLIDEIVNVGTAIAHGLRGHSRPLLVAQGVNRLGQDLRFQSLRAVQLDRNDLLAVLERERQLVDDPVRLTARLQVF